MYVYCVVLRMGRSCSSMLLLSITMFILAVLQSLFEMHGHHVVSVRVILLPRLIANQDLNLVIYNLS